MGKVGASILGAVIGGFAAVSAIVLWFGWGMPGKNQAAHLDPTRADYVDLLLTIATIFLGAVGLTVTVGALVIGLVALKTLREIKEEAAQGAKQAASAKIDDTVANELFPMVNKKISEDLELALQIHLADDKHREAILISLARTGALDDAVARTMDRISFGGPIQEPAAANDETNEGDSQD